MFRSLIRFSASAPKPVFTPYTAGALIPGLRDRVDGPPRRDHPLLRLRAERHGALAARDVLQRFEGERASNENR
jgi:hypothetical protein